jgi:uncharacterized protein involved in exopolysaccharide biosynthesis
MEESNFRDYRGTGDEIHTPTPRDLLAIAFRHRRLMVLSFLGVLSGAILTAVLQSNRYDAGMKILVKPGRVDPIATPEAAQPQFAAGVTEEELNSEVELLKSRDLLEKTVQTCDLQNQNQSAWSKLFASIGGSREPRAPGKDPRIAKAVLALEKDLRVEALKKTNLIAVNYESTDPELAARVLNSLANLYLEKHVAVHRAPGAFDFFQQQTQQYRKGLADAEAHLVDFTHGGSVVSAQLEKEAALQKLAEFEATLKQTKAAIAETQQRIHMLEEQTGSMPSRMVTQVRNADDPLILSQLRSNLLTLELKRTELLEKFEPGYRAVQEVDAQIAQTRTALAAAEKSQLHEETTDRDPAYEWVREELAKAKSELAGLQARAEATALTVQSYRENARSLEQKEVVQDDLIRTVKATEESYLLYLRKEEEARISDALDRRRIINVSIAEPASVPSLPSNHRGLTVLVGMFLATLTSLGLVFGSEHLDPTFRTPDEVRSVLNIPVLAAMPQNGHGNGNGNGNRSVGKNGKPHVSRVL